MSSPLNAAAAGGPPAANPTQSAQASPSSTSTGSPDTHDQFIAKIIAIVIVSVYGVIFLATVVAWFVRLGTRPPTQGRPKAKFEGPDSLKTDEKLTESFFSDAPVSESGMEYSKQRRYRQSAFNLSREHRRAHSGIQNLPKGKSPAHPLALGPDSLEMEKYGERSFSLDLERNVGGSDDRYRVTSHNLLDDNRSSQPKASSLSTKWNREQVFGSQPPMESHQRASKRASRPRPAPITVFPTIKDSPLPFTSPIPATPALVSVWQRNQPSASPSTPHSVKSSATFVPGMPSPASHSRFSNATTPADLQFTFDNDAIDDIPPQIPTLSDLEDGRF